MKIDVGALRELLRKLPPDVIGYERGGPLQQAFERGWRENAQRIYTTLRLEEAREACHEELLAALRAAARCLVGEGSPAAVQEYQEALMACRNAGISPDRILVSSGLVST